MIFPAIHTTSRPSELIAGAPYQYPPVQRRGEGRHHPIHRAGIQVDVGNSSLMVESTAEIRENNMCLGVDRCRGQYEDQQGRVH